MKKRVFLLFVLAFALSIGFVSAACPHGCEICGIRYDCGDSDGVCPEDYGVGNCYEFGCSPVDPDCSCVPGATRACSCSFKTCTAVNVCTADTQTGIQTCTAAGIWSICDADCKVTNCNVNADCTGTPCFRRVSEYDINSNMFVEDASDTATCFNDECVYNGNLFASNLGAPDSWDFVVHPNPHFGVDGDTNINIICSAASTSPARWANANYAQDFCLDPSVGGVWNVGFGDADTETNYYTDAHSGDPVYCNNLRADWTGTPSQDCCCGDDTGETYRYFMTIGDSGANPASCDDVTDEYCVNGGRDDSDFACCNDDDDCIYQGVCYAQDSTRDLNGDGRLDGWCMTDDSYKGNWRDCDSYQNNCDGQCNADWATGGESAGFGEYDAGTSLECCGDDSNEYFILNDIFGTNYSACCNAGTDCVDETNTCRDGTEVCDNGLDDDCDGFIDASDTDCPEGAGPDEASPLRLCTDGAEQDFPGNSYIDYDDYKCSDKCNLQVHPVTGEVMFFDNSTYNTNFFGNAYGVGFSSWDPGTVIFCCGDDSGEFYMTTLSNLNPGDDDPVLHACCNESTKCVDSSGVCQVGSEEVFDLCINGLDDDCDGFVDGDDTNCTGVLQGFVFDQLGFPVAGALVKGSPAGFGSDYESLNTTLIDGSYVINNALVGTYNFIARKEGYDDNVSMTTIISDASVLLNFTLRNGSCHYDCTDHYGNCNPVCDGLIFGSDNCNFISDLCFNVPVGQVVTFHNETTGVITEYTCCEGPIRTYPALKPTVTGNVEDLYDYVVNVKMGGRWVKMHILVWNPE